MPLGDRTMACLSRLLYLTDLIQWKLHTPLCKTRQCSTHLPHRMTKNKITTCLRCRNPQAASSLRLLLAHHRQLVEVLPTPSRLVLTSCYTWPIRQGRRPSMSTISQALQKIHHPHHLTNMPISPHQSCKHLVTLACSMVLYTHQETSTLPISVTSHRHQLKLNSTETEHRSWDAHLTDPREEA